MKRIVFSPLLLLAILIAACTSPTSSPPAATPISEPTTQPEIPATEVTMALELTSEAFLNGQSIPAKYSCTGKDISPALTWSEPPAGTQSLALIMDDPDAPGGTWVHWVLYNIPADRRDLPEDLPVTGKNIDPEAIYVGKNSWGNIGYGGPCPPSGTHRYFFKLYALDTLISLLPGATKEQVLREMEGHILAQAEQMGTFKK
jgi:Raf kinase inhibitor-like YbhB/YbcL family protein